MSKKLFAGLAAVIFSFGFYFGYSMNEDYGLNPVIRVRLDGKVAAFARTGAEYGKVVMMNDVPDPGAYLAFPLYADRNNVDRLLQ